MNLPARSWALAQAVNELRVVGPRWCREPYGGNKDRWVANGCRTHMGPLSGATCDLRVEQVRANCYLGQAFVWPADDRAWDEITVVTILPSRVKHSGWWSADDAKTAMTDLLYDKPYTERFHIRVEPREGASPAGPAKAATMKQAAQGIGDPGLLKPPDGR